MTDRPAVRCRLPAHRVPPRGFQHAPRHRRSRLQALTLPFGRRQTPTERLHLGPAARGLLAHPAPHILDLATMLLGRTERLLRVVQLAFAGLEIGQDARETCSARSSSPRTASIRAVRDASAARSSRALDSRSTADRNACSASLRSTCAARNPCSASTSARDAVARSSAAVNTRPSISSNRCRAVLRVSRPSSQPVWRRSFSRSKARSLAAANLRDSSSACALNVSCFFAISACCCSGFSWRRSSASTSCSRRRSWSRPPSFRSARSFRRRCLAMPAASSMYLRRSSGRARSTSSSWPCPTTVCSARPIPVSDNSSWRSRRRTT